MSAFVGEVEEQLTLLEEFVHWIPEKSSRSGDVLCW
jgi:hypothetical protein